MERNRQVLDCRQMEPPEPFVRVMEAVATMKEGEELMMLHSHRPGAMFFDKLLELNLQHSFNALANGQVEILIWR